MNECLGVLEQTLCGRQYVLLSSGVHLRVTHDAEALHETNEALWFRATVQAAKSTSTSAWTQALIQVPT